MTFFIYIIVSESIYSLFIKKHSSDFGVEMFLAGFVRSAHNSTWNTFEVFDDLVSLLPSAQLPPAC